VWSSSSLISSSCSFVQSCTRIIGIIVSRNVRSPEFRAQ
jgi:hypothetical protein